MKTNIVLIGFMGAGKTEVGRLLAEKRGYNFVDLDYIAEIRESMTINEIFKQKGETYFRDIENKILKDFKKNKDNILSSLKNFIPITLASSKSGNLIINGEDKRWVISTGGGMPVYKNNMEMLKILGYVLYLKAGAKTIYRRIRSEKNRPVLGESGFSEKDIKNILEERENVYKKADMIIYTDGLSQQGVAEEIDIFVSNL
ncbi:MAG: shikimate kinase [Deltaproteobacteria bacterium]|jgi:shikimate kinase|nr:shikimate kinase [Deltaproteobacteria bacterium]MCL5880340.1 shikimate kinase [Deltaproteobacteria bacterium]MDA8303621.1 shikimate kinase [Deltaproteobacteria bacterium]